MQFLHEEFFGKTYRFIKGINVFAIRTVALLLFYIFILAIIGFIAVMIVLGNVKWVFIVLGAILVAEIAHFARKSREKIINEKVSEESNIQDQLSEADVIKKEPHEKAVNKGLLTKKKIRPKKTKVRKIKIPIKTVKVKGFKKVKIEKPINKKGLLKK